MPTVTGPQRAEVTIVEQTSDANAGHVVLGVLGGLAFVFVVVFIVVPLVRWRRRRAGWAVGGERSASTSTARRAHIRLPSGAPTAAVNRPLLEEPLPTQQRPMSMVRREGTQPIMATMPKKEPSRPRTVELGWKILTTLPSFDDEEDRSTVSSFGRPLATGERVFAEKPTLRRVDEVRLSAALPPIPPISSDADNPSRQSTLVAQVSPTPSNALLTTAFQIPLTPVTSDVSTSQTNGGSVFRYPSVVASDSSKNSDAPGLNQNSTAAVVTRTPSSSWVPPDLVPTPDAEKPSLVPPETWWRKPPMPPIPEAAGSSSAHSSMHMASPVFIDSPPPTARLRDSQQSAAKGSIRRARISDQTGTSVSRSNTQQTSHSISGSIVDRERPVSNITAATFGGPIRPDDIILPSLPVSNSVPFPASPAPPDLPAPDPENAALRSRFSTNTTARGEATTTTPEERRVSRDYAREPSPPLEHMPLTHPPPLRIGSTPSPRLGSLPASMQQENMPQRQSITQPQPGPQSPEDERMPEAGPSRVSVYGRGHNEEASNSSEQLIPEDVEPEIEPEPMRLELPGLRPLSPIQLDFRFGSPSPSSTPSRGSTRKRRRGRGTGPYSGHSKSASKSTAGGSSKRSLRSLASAISEGMRSRASSLSRSSRSRSLERGGLVRHHSRRVTFGEPPDNSPPPMPSPGPNADDALFVATKPARRPLPALPLYSPISPTQTSEPGPAGGPRHDYDVP